MLARGFALAFLSAATAAVAAPTGAQPRQLTVQPGMAKELVRMIEASGYACPEIRAIYHVGSDNRGNVMRIVCGAGSATADPPSFRLHSTSAGVSKISRWEP